jgi:hypothetical protein
VSSSAKHADQARLASLLAEFDVAREAMAAEFARPVGGGSLRSKRHARAVDANIRRTAATGDRVASLEREAVAIRARLESAPAPAGSAEMLRGARFERDRYGWHEVVRVNAHRDRPHRLWLGRPDRRAQDLRMEVTPFRRGRRAGLDKRPWVFSLWHGSGQEMTVDPCAG